MNSPKNLIVPPSAVTDSSVSVVWDPPADERPTAYRVLVNGEMFSETNKCCATVDNLTAESEYIIEVLSLSEKGAVSEAAQLKVSTLKASPVLSILDFGAVADGKTINTKAIQSAIDACPEYGTVLIPKGVFVSGAVFLKSKMTLRLDEGAKLLGSTNNSDYPVFKYRFEGTEQDCYSSLVNTPTGNERLSDIKIIGSGTIDASGTPLKITELEENKGKRGRAVCIRNTDGVYINGVTIRHSPAWCLHLVYCSDISINDVKVYTKYAEDGTKYDVFNGDGIDPDSSNNIYIFNSLIASQDDCIAIKSGKDEEGRRIGIPSENIRITDCVFKSGFGVAVGSEMSGSVRNVLVRDCEFTDTYSFASVKCPRGRGGIIENVLYENIKFSNNSTEHKDCRWFRGGLYVDNFYSHEEFDHLKAEEKDESTPLIRNIHFKNIEASTISGNAIFMSGLPESCLENITLENVTAHGKFGMKAYNIKDLTAKNLTVTADNGEAYEYSNIE